MACYHPKRVLMEDGQILWTERQPEHYAQERVLIKCGKCLGCRRATQRDWSLRCFHEALHHNHEWRDPLSRVATTIPNSCVVTLTYNEEHLPANGALHYPDFQNFMKRLRVRRARNPDLAVPAKSEKQKKPSQIRYFMCGEYGRKGRPHFHAILYSETFEDRYTVVDRNDHETVMSYELDKLWSKAPFPGSPPTNIGRASVDEFTYAGAAYVAGYVMKKAGDEHLGPWHETISTITGEVTVKPIKPEFRKMSLGTSVDKLGGLGKAYLEANYPRIYDEDLCRIGEYSFKPPRYYDTLLARHNPDLLSDVKERRHEAMVETANEWTPERCTAAETIEFSRLRSRQQHLD